MRVLAVTVTEAGRALANRLPYERRHGGLGEAVRSSWNDVDGFVLFASAGIAVRTIAPLLKDKTIDPAVVCVDESGRWVVALCGGHTGGANALATEVGALLGAEPVVTTGTDAAGLPGLDTLVGFGCSGDVAAVSRALLDGETVTVENHTAWALPTGLADRLVAFDGSGVGASSSARRVLVDHRQHPDRPGLVVLHPPALVLGIGTSSDAPPAELDELISATLAEAGLAIGSVSAVATLDRKRGEPAIAAAAQRLGVRLLDFPAATLAAVPVPTPSETVRAAVGTPSVCEAAALTGAGPGSELLVAKRRSSTATVAVALRSRPVGTLAVVGIGPGAPQHRTPAATAAVRSSNVVIGYGPYIDLVADAIGSGCEVVRSPIGDEAVRSALALGRAAAGDRVALVCSGDAGIYALATLVFELTARHPGLDPGTIEVIPGVTAALSSAAVLGAPLGHDHVAISLSDLLTPWSLIEQRIRAAAASDLVISFYNPRSAGRNWQLGAARDIVAAHRPPETPVGIVTDAGRSDQRMVLSTISEFDPADVGMTSCVLIGSSTTRIVGGRMFTPRGYQP